MKLEKCPFCGGEADIFEASEDSFCALCTGCGVETPYQISAEEAVAAWNRRAKPENSRQHALQTGVCPMCEDCPDGCPVETPNDSRNRPENKPLTLEQLREMVDSDECGVHIWVRKTVSRSVVSALTDVTCPDGVVAIWNAHATENFKEKDYGQTWLAYRHKPEGGDSNA